MAVDPPRLIVTAEKEHPLAPTGPLRSEHQRVAIRHPAGDVLVLRLRVRIDRHPSALGHDTEHRGMGPSPGGQNPCHHQLVGEDRIPEAVQAVGVVAPDEIAQLLEVRMQPGGPGFQSIDGRRQRMKPMSPFRQSPAPPQAGRTPPGAEELAAQPDQTAAFQVKTAPGSHVRVDAEALEDIPVWQRSATTAILPVMDLGASPGNDERRGSAYWDGVGRRWRDGPRSLWREFTDRQQFALIAAWLPLGSSALSSGSDAAVTTVLKTDLFDEVAHRGLVAGLLGAGLQVAGIDVSPLIVAEALARNPGLEARQADVRRLPFPEGHFDGVYSGSTLDHFETTTSIAEALVEIARVLRPGGRLILTLDNPDNLLIGLRNGPLLAVLRRLGIVPYQVGVTLARGPLLQALQAAGFEVLATRALQHCPRVLAVGLAPIIGWLPRPCQGVFLRLLAGCEGLARLPSCWWTAHYIAVLARKR